VLRGDRNSRFELSALLLLAHLLQSTEFAFSSERGAFGEHHGEFDHKHFYDGAMKHEQQHHAGLPGVYSD